MKIKKAIILLTTLIITQISFGQKVKIKKNIAYVNKEAICIIEKDDVVPGSFYINDLKNERKLYFKWVNWSVDSYFALYKADNLDDILFDTDDGIGFRKWAIKTLYKAKVLIDDGIDEAKLNELTKKMGKEYTRRRNSY